MATCRVEACQQVNHAWITPPNAPPPILPQYEVRHIHSSTCRRLHDWKRCCALLWTPVGRLVSSVGSLFFIPIIDWSMLGVVGFIMYLFWSSQPVYTNRLVPLSTPDGALYRPDLAYPYIPPVFSSILAGLLAAVIPITVFLLAQLKLHSFADLGAAILGLGYSLVTGTFIQVILKKLIGGFRPHFFSVCQPVLPALQGSLGRGFNHTMYLVQDICTGSDKKAISNALESFPSGHAVIAFAAFGYLALYLFTHLHILSTDRFGPSKDFELLAVY